LRVAQSQKSCRNGGAAKRYDVRRSFKSCCSGLSPVPPRMLRALDIKSASVAEPLMATAKVIEENIGTLERPIALLRRNSKWSRHLSIQETLLHHQRPHDPRHLINLCHAHTHWRVAHQHSCSQVPGRANGWTCRFMMTLLAHRCHRRPVTSSKPIARTRKILLRSRIRMYGAIFTSVSVFAECSLDPVLSLLSGLYCVVQKPFHRMEPTCSYSILKRAQQSVQSVCTYHSDRSGSLV
jgi:hypothetical protein